MLSDNEEWFVVSLRFSGDELPIEEIEEMLEISPTSFAKKGQHVNNNPKKYGKSPTNVWVWDFTQDTTIPFEDQLKELSKLLLQKKNAINEILHHNGVTGDLCLSFASGSGQGGAFLPPDILRSFGELNLSISLDLYPPDMPGGYNRTGTIYPAGTTYIDGVPMVNDATEDNE